MPAPTADEVARAEADFARARKADDALGMEAAGRVLARHELARVQPVRVEPRTLVVHPLVGDTRS